MGDFALILTFGGILILLSSAVYGLYKRRKTIRERIEKKWEQQEKEKPEDFLADDEWQFVKYKDMILPMTALEKKERWDTMKSAEKREVYLEMQRCVKKGRIKKVETEEGELYVATDKGEDFVLKQYKKMKTDYERKFGRKFGAIR